MSATADIATLTNPTAAEQALAAAFAAQRAPSEAQRAAWARFTESGLPHRRIEGWRWSDVRRAITDGVEPSLDPGGLLVGARVEGLRHDLGEGPEGLTVIEVGGAEPPGEPPQGVAIHRQGDPNRAAWAAGHPLAQLVQSLAPDATVIEIAEPQERPLLLLTGGAPFERVAVVLRDGASATVIEAPLAPSAGFAARFVDIGLQAGAALEWVSAAPAVGGAHATVQGVHLAADARYRQTALCFGAKLARLETHVTVDGPGAEATLNGVSLLAGEAHADHTTLVTHTAPGARTRETFRTVATDRATGVFQGKIKVERPAQQTDAEMDHKALLLAEGAAANAKPELEIYADDVACAHGNTAGALDADALHYMRARGLPEARAKALLIEAFVAEALDGIGHDGARAALRAEARRWMEAQL